MHKSPRKEKQIVETPDNSDYTNQTVSETQKLSDEFNKGVPDLDAEQGCDSADFGEPKNKKPSANRAFFQNLVELNIVSAKRADIVAGICDQAGISIQQIFEQANPMKLLADREQSKAQWDAYNLEVSEYNRQLRELLVLEDKSKFRRELAGDLVKSLLEGSIREGLDMAYSDMIDKAAYLTDGLLDKLYPTQEVVFHNVADEAVNNLTNMDNNAKNNTQHDINGSNIDNRDKIADNGDNRDKIADNPSISKPFSPEEADKWANSEKDHTIFPPTNPKI